jgi:hypothetical protein
VVLKSHGLETKDVGTVIGFRKYRSKLRSWNRNYLPANFIDKS